MISEEEEEEDEEGDIHYMYLAESKFVNISCYLWQQLITRKLYWELSYFRALTPKLAKPNPKEHWSLFHLSCCCCYLKRHLLHWSYAGKKDLSNHTQVYLNQRNWINSVEDRCRNTQRPENSSKVAEMASKCGFTGKNSRARLFETRLTLIEGPGA